MSDFNLESLSSSETFKRREAANETLDLQQKLDKIRTRADAYAEQPQLTLPSGSNQAEIDGFCATLGYYTGKMTGSIASGIVEGGLKAVLGTVDGLSKGLVGMAPSDLWQHLLKNQGAIEKIMAWYKDFRRAEIRATIDEVYAQGLGVQIRADGKFHVVNADGTDCVATNGPAAPLGIFNDFPPATLKKSWTDVEKKANKDLFASVLVERAITCRGIGDVQKLNAQLGVDVTDKAQIDRVFPNQISEAYKALYKGKQLPPELRDLVKNVESKTVTQDHMQATRRMFEEYGGIVTGTKFDLKLEAGKQLSGVVGLFQNPPEALSKIRNPAGLLSVIGILAYLLLFSEHKKMAWLSLGAIYGGDALASMIDPEGKGLFDRGQDWIKYGFGDGKNPYLTREYLKKLTEKPEEVRAASVIMAKKRDDILDRVTVGGDNSVAFDYSTFNDQEKQDLMKAFKTEDAAKKIVRETVEKFLDMAARPSEKHAATLNRLKAEYGGRDASGAVRNPNQRFGEIVLSEIVGAMDRVRQTTAPVWAAGLDSIANPGARNAVSNALTEYMSDDSKAVVAARTLALQGRILRATPTDRTALVSAYKAFAGEALARRVASLDAANRPAVQTAVAAFVADPENQTNRDNLRNAVLAARGAAPAPLIAARGVAPANLLAPISLIPAAPSPAQTAALADLEKFSDIVL